MFVAIVVFLWLCFIAVVVASVGGGVVFRVFHLVRPFALVVVPVVVLMVGVVGLVVVIDVVLVLVPRLCY